MMKNTRLHTQLGFTFVELIVVVTLTAMLILSATAMLMSTLLSSGRSNNVQSLKENGDYALGQMEFLLRNAIELLPNSDGEICEQTMDEIVFRSIDDGITTLGIDTDGGVDKIASNSGYLTSDSVEIVSGPEFNCYTSADYLIQTVDIEFTLRKGEENADPDAEVIEETFRTSVSLRSF